MGFVGFIVILWGFMLCYFVGFDVMGRGEGGGYHSVHNEEKSASHVPVPDELLSWFKV